MSRYTLKIKALEDLHVGTGLGVGDIDALQSRDRKDRPCLPATHIKGVLRAQAECLPGMAPSAIQAIFGDPGTHAGALALTSAWLDGKKNEIEHPLLIWGSTRIDPQTGTAAEGSLRFVEYIRAESCFTAHLSLPDNAILEEDFQRILEVTTHLGHGRHRGYGRVHWQLEKETTPCGAGAIKTTPTHYPARLRLILRNLDPLCLAKTGHPGNVIPTEAFIRARAVRGALMALALDTHCMELAQALHQPTILWGDALPLPETENGDAKSLEGCTVKPIPLSIGTPKAAALSGLIPAWAQGKSARYLGDRDEIEKLSTKDEPEEKTKRPDANEYLYRARSQSEVLGC